MGEDERLDRRVWRMSDVQRDHEVQIARHELMINSLGTAVDTLRATMATREQVAGLSETIALKLENLNNIVGPIRNGVYWAIALILAAFVAALWTLVVNGPPPKLIP